MKQFKIYRPNMSDYKVVEGNSMTVTEDGKTNIWKDGVIVAVVPVVHKNYRHNTATVQ